MSASSNTNNMELSIGNVLAAKEDDKQEFVLKYTDLEAECNSKLNTEAYTYFANGNGQENDSENEEIQNITEATEENLSISLENSPSDTYCNSTQGDNLDAEFLQKFVNLLQEKSKAADDQRMSEGSCIFRLGLIGRSSCDAPSSTISTLSNVLDLLYTQPPDSKGEIRTDESEEEIFSAILSGPEDPWLHASTTAPSTVKNVLPGSG